MAKVLEKPYSTKDRADFIVKYNHQLGKIIEETDIALYALEPWETIENDQIITDMEGYKARKAEEEKQNKKQKLMEKLDALDLKSIRAIRAGDQDYIAKYEAEAQELRRQLQELG